MSRTRKVSVMNSFKAAPRKWLNRIVTALAIVGGASEIVCAQSNVGTGEPRFNAAIYKASHNSYAREESLRAQIDDFNCWCLELDLHWDESSSEVRVSHLCIESEGLLTDWLRDTAQAVTGPKRLTVISLEMKADLTCDDWLGLITSRRLIKQSFSDIFGLIPSTLPQGLTPAILAAGHRRGNYRQQQTELSS